MGDSGRFPLLFFSPAGGRLRSVRASLLAAVVATVALSCGGGEQTGSAGAAAAVGVAASAAELPAITPAGAEEILATVRAADRPVLVNMWATWCLPCREEFPDLMRVYRERDIRLVLVSADFPDQVEQARSFLAEQGVDFPSFLKQGRDMDFIDAFSPEWSGALPATFIFGEDGELRVFWEGLATYEMMTARLDAALKVTVTDSDAGG